jgi:solute:Na+ symporter, SSS family
MTTHALSTVDGLIVVLYLAGTLAVGAWFARRQRDLRSYFVGDRNVSWWLVLVSIVATETSTVTFLSVPGLAYNSSGGNLTFLQLAFGYIIGRFVIAWLLLPLYRRGELLSAYQVLRDRFNVTVQRTASGLFLVTRTIADGLRLYLAATLLQEFTGWSSTASIVVIGFATVLYTYAGGVQAVIWTDLIQFLVYVAGAVLAGCFMLNILPGGMHEFLATGEAAGKFRVVDLSTDLTQRYTLWTGLIGGAFLTMASHGADQMMVQRYLCSRSLTQARVALVLSGFVVLLQFLFFLLLGVGLYVLHAQGYLPQADGRENDQVFGVFIVHELPRGLVGLVLASVLAAAMATLASSLNSSASALVADFYRPLHPDRNEVHYLFVSRVVTVGWGFARMGVALAAVVLLRQRSVIDAVLTVAGFTTGMILGLFLLGRLDRPVRSRAALAGLVAGFALVFWIWAKTDLAWPWYAPIGTLTTVLTALAANAYGSPGNRGPQPGVGKPG